MTVGKIRTLTSAGLLLISMQICLAAQQPAETFKILWSTYGQKAEQEIGALPKAGRAALQKALIACSLFADDYLSAQYQTECKKTSKFFVVEFSSESSFLKLLLETTVTVTNVHQTQALLDAQQGRRGQIYDPQPWKVYIEILQKAYHDAVVAPPLGAGSNDPSKESAPSSAPILIPLQKEGGTYVVPVLINNAITLNFTVDSGAADVVIPADVFTTLVRTGTIQETDLLGTKTYTLGDGSTRSAQTFRLRSLTIGGKVIEDVTGSVAPVEGLLLLGQTFLERFKSWSIDNAKHSLVLSPSPTRDVPLVVSPAQASGTGSAASSPPPQTQRPKKIWPNAYAGVATIDLKFR
jgi:predicted aspartyl protease